MASIRLLSGGRKGPHAPHAALRGELAEADAVGRDYLGGRGRARGTRRTSTRTGSRDRRRARAAGVVAAERSAAQPHSTATVAPTTTTASAGADTSGSISARRNPSPVGRSSSHDAQRRFSHRHTRDLDTRCDRMRCRSERSVAASPIERFRIHRSRTTGLRTVDLEDDNEPIASDVTCTIRRHSRT